MKGRGNFRIDAEDLEFFKEYCKRKNTTISKVVRNVIKKFIEYERSKKND